MKTSTTNSILPFALTKKAADALCDDIYKRSGQQAISLTSIHEHLWKFILNQLDRQAIISLKTIEDFLLEKGSKVSFPKGLKYFVVKQGELFQINTLKHTYALKGEKPGVVIFETLIED